MGAVNVHNGGYAYPLKPKLSLDISRFFQLKLNTSIAKILPRQLYRFYFFLLGLAYLAVRKDLRQKISLCCDTVFGPGQACRVNRPLPMEIYSGLIDHYFEKMWNVFSPVTSYIEYIRTHTTIIGKEWLDSSLRENRGILLLTGHFGGVEYITVTLSVNGYKSTIIARFKTAKLLKDTLPRGRKINIEVIDAAQPNVLFKACRALKEGRILVTLCDEFSHWIPSADKRTTVFGHTIAADKTLDVLQCRARVPVCLGLMRRCKVDYRLEIYPIPVRDMRNASLCDLSWKMLEPFVLKSPSQWYQWQEVLGNIRKYQQRSLACRKSKSPDPGRLIEGRPRKECDLSSAFSNWSGPALGL